MSSTDPNADPADQEATESSVEPEVANDENPEAERIAILEAEAAANWEKYLRAAAELDNVRKRANRDVENAHKFAVEKFAADLLAVADSLSMGLEAADGTEAIKLREGSEATLKLLQQVFERFGIALIDPHGEPFDPEFHEAMTMQPAADTEPNTVLTVVQQGYTLNGRLLRPARVIVSAPS